MTAAHYKGGHYPGNDLGLHYTAFPPIVASCPYSDQLLATRKFWSPGANRPSQVRCKTHRNAAVPLEQGWGFCRSMPPLTARCSTELLAIPPHDRGCRLQPNANAAALID